MNKFLALVVFVILLVPSATYANLLINPGFETGDFSGWSVIGSANINNVAHSGSHSATASVNSLPGFYPSNGGQNVAISDPNIPFLIGGWINEPSSNPLINSFAGITIYFYNATPSSGPVGIWGMGTDGQSYAKDTWNDFTAQLVPSGYGPGIVSASILWQVGTPGGGSGSVMFDDLEISPVPEPASLLILGAGLFGLRMFGKKRV